jgi:hypothetical protein
MNIFMDSGAFSALNKKQKINLTEYMDFLKRNMKYFSAYVVLDVIGDAVATWKNQEIMEKEGLSPLPVYHFRDNPKYLDRCLEYDYFCLGGIAGTPTNNVRIPFFNDCFDKICNEEGIPQNKVHGLGMTSFSLIRRYPFYSVDSTSWLMNGAMGGIIVPIRRRGVFVYDEDPFKIAVSGTSPQTGRDLHYDSLNMDAKKNVDDYLKFKGYFLGRKDVDNKHEEAGLYSSHYERMKLNMEFFIDFRNSLPKWPWPIKFHKQKRRLW